MYSRKGTFSLCVTSPKHMWQVSLLLFCVSNPQSSRQLKVHLLLRVMVWRLWHAWKTNMAFLEGPVGSRIAGILPLQDSGRNIIKMIGLKKRFLSEYIFHQISRRFLSFLIYVFCLLSFYPRGCCYEGLVTGEGKDTCLVSWDQVQVTAWLQVTQEACSIIQLNHSLDKSENR